MFAGASSRLRTQAGNNYSAVPSTLSYLLNLSLNPATEKHQLVAAAESDPAILAEFLALEPPEQLATWHEPFNPIHFLVTAVRLVMGKIQHPPSLEQWKSNITHWQDALFQQYLAENIAETQDDASIPETRLTGLLASTIENPVFNLPDEPRDAIRFQFAPVDALKDTHQLIRMIAATTQIQQNTNVPIREDYLDDWGLPGINLSAEVKKAREKVSKLINTIEQPGENAADQYRSDLELLNQAMKRFQYKVIFDQQFADAESLISEVDQLGAALFELSNCTIFEVTDDGYRHGTTTITSEKSIVARAVEKKSIVTSAEISLIVIDQQMLEQSRSDTLIASPLVHKGEVIGVLVAGANWRDPNEHLGDLEIFTRSIAAALSTSVSNEMISIEELQHRAREIGHEVSNPFTIAQNYLKILSIKLGEEHEATGSIGTISNEIQRAAELIKQYSHIGDKSISDTTATDCNGIVQELIGIFKGSYPDITFTTQLDRDDEGTTLAPDQFKQIIINLVKNAAEAMDSTGEILIRSTANIRFPDANYIELEVVDTGPGISPGLTDILFTPGATSKSDPNAGLGLGIVKDILTSAAGTISFRTGNTGTTFTLLLPQAKSRSGPAIVKDPL
jgi:signal transduction histidine kinase